MHMLNRQYGARPGKLLMQNVARAKLPEGIGIVWHSVCSRHCGAQTDKKRDTSHMIKRGMGKVVRVHQISSQNCDSHLSTFYGFTTGRA